MSKLAQWVKTGMIKYAYVKNGDVSAQLSRIAQSGDKLITSGPDAFLADFLEKTQPNPVLLIGQGLKNSYIQQGSVTARVFNIQNGLILKIFGRTFAFFSLIIYLLRFKPDRILCGRTGSMLWACYLVSRLYSVPLVHSRHNQVIFPNHPWFKRLSSIIDNWCINRSKNVVCHGPYLKDQLKAIGVPASNIIEFDVGFDDMLAENNPPPNTSAFNHLQNAKIILFIGRVQTNKGILDLLEACIPIIKNDSTIKLVYIGTGSDIKLLKQHIETNNQQSNVILQGEMSHADITHMLSLSHIMVAPTRPDFPEGRCMTVMESLVMGVPVIAPNFGPFPYLVTHNKNGLLYQPGSVDDLKKNLEKIIKDDDLHNQLKSGAYISGNRLKKPILAFGEAVIKAFKS